VKNLFLTNYQPKINYKDELEGLQEFHEEKLWKIIKGPNRQTLLAPLVEIV